MGMFFSNIKDEFEEESGKIGFSSFREPSLRERYRSLTGDTSEGLSKSEMIKRLEDSISEGFEPIRVLSKMNDLKSDIENTIS